MLRRLRADDRGAQPREYTPPVVDIGHRRAAASCYDPPPMGSTGQEPDARPRGRYLALLSLGALGVVYGDIGTSPLYTLRECFHSAHGVAATHANVLGILSLIFWALILIISVKYLTFVLRADNRGEGGILALVSLLHPGRGKEEHLPAGRLRWGLTLIGLFGAALLYGEGMITPAISVLSAVEGLGVATPVFEPYILPITVTLLVLLFIVQRYGTGRVGAIFGPVMLLWFVTIGILGVVAIADYPAVLAAVNPWHAIDFFLRNQLHGYLVLGSVILVVTGGEALYLDMGHFGARPIRCGWFGVALPALLLNYYGQGALMLARPETVDNPFYRLAPEWALYPLVALATLATVIASQAVISGAFSLTMQAVQLGFAPRMQITYTSAREMGQIYVPAINWILMTATVLLTLGFRSSSNLAAAYGFSVSSTMVLTTVIFYFVARRLWKWPPLAIGGLCTVFLIIDVAFCSATMIKIPEGAWFPLVMGVVIFTVLSTWWTGRKILAARLEEATVAVEIFRADAVRREIHRVPGTAVFLTGSPRGSPPALLHNVKHNKVLHETVVVLRVVTEEIPHVRQNRRVAVEELGEGFFRIVLRYGFMDTPNVPRALSRIDHPGLDFAEMKTTYFLGRNRVLAGREREGMAVWREKLFAVMARNSQDATTYFRLPPNRVVEVGAQVEI